MLTITTPPTLQAITLAEAKAHLRVTASTEDTLITALIDAATGAAEHLMQRAIMPQGWTLYLDAWDDPAGRRTGLKTGIALQRPTVTAVTSVKYLAGDTGTLTTLDPSQYVAELGGLLYGRVVPAYGVTWPDTRDLPGAAQIAFTAGWANAAAVPPEIKAWLNLRVGALYENRESWTLGKAIEPNQFIDSLLGGHCIVTV